MTSECCTLAVLSLTNCANVAFSTAKFLIIITFPLQVQWWLIGQNVLGYWLKGRGFKP